MSVAQIGSNLRVLAESGEGFAATVRDALRAAGVEVIERPVRYEEVAAADEIFSTGNYSKVLPVNRIDGRDLQPGPFYRKARELYFDFARESGFRL